MRLAFTIQKYNPEIDQHPHDEIYHLDVSPILRSAEVLPRQTYTHQKQGQNFH